MHEFETIVEFSYNSKQESFVIRFLSGESYVLKTADLPKKYQTKVPDWENATLSQDKSLLLIPAGSETRELPTHIIHSRGKLL